MEQRVKSINLTSLTSSPQDLPKMWQIYWTVNGCHRLEHCLIEPSQGSACTCEVTEKSTVLNSLLLVLRGQIAERRGCCRRGRSSLLHSVMHIQLSVAAVAVRQLAGGGSELRHSTHCARTCTSTGARDSGRTDGHTQQEALVAEEIYVHSAQ
jgi:hypothetical protein